MPFSADKVGLAHRFHAGGSRDMRGFRVRGMGPVDDREEDLHIGGATKTTLRSEIRYAINDHLQVPLFLDAGTLSEDSFDIGSLRATVGLGARFTFPGLNQKAFFYLAQNLLSKSTDDERSFIFGFEYSF